jgi:uncharacterized protein involved in exopolysaccharide biosynthesis
MSENHDRHRSTTGEHAAASSVPTPSTPTENRDLGTADDVTLLELLNALLRRWKLAVGLPIGAAIITAAISLLIPPTYTAGTAFVPELGSQRGLAGGLSGLASQFGVALPTETGQTAEFYAQVLKTPGIMNQILLSRFADPRSTDDPQDSTTLLALLDVEGDSLADSLFNARKVMAKKVSAQVDNMVSIVTLTVDSRYPILAAAVANRLVEALNEFNTTTRQSRSRERRRFVEERLAEADQELREAEAAIREFYERNRTWESSPQLRFEQEQLQRRVQTRLEVVLTLRREYETARIEEVNDTPIITVIFAATPPQERSKPKRKLLVALALAVGLFLSLLIVFWAVFAERERRNNRDRYSEFRGLLTRVGQEVRRPFHPAGRARS